MKLYKVYFKESFLAHHGVKNQKWGVRNGPPYPLSADKHKAVISGYIVDKKLEDSNNINKRFANAYTNVNPSGSRSNCKEVAYTTCDNFVNNCHNTAPSQRIEGGVYDLIESKVGSSLAEIVVKQMRVVDESPHKQIDNYLLKRYSEGDIGIVGVTFDHRYLKSDLITMDGHAFNWVILDGKVKYVDAQPAEANTNPEKYFKLHDRNKEIEIFRFGNKNGEKFDDNITKSIKHNGIKYSQHRLYRVYW